MTHLIRYVDVLGDGNCFYRAFFKAALSKRLLKLVIKALSMRGRTPPPHCCDVENDFITFVRTCLSHVVLAQDRRIRKVFENIWDVLIGFASASQDSITDFCVWSGFPDWISHYFIHTNVVRWTFSDFVSDAADSVLLNGVFAGNIDLVMLNLILTDIDVCIICHTSLSAFPSIPRPRDIYLLLVNFNHYRTVVYDSQGGE